MPTLYTHALIGLLTAMTVSCDHLRHDERLSAERLKASSAIAAMGTSGQFYVVKQTLDGPVNHLELAPRGSSVNDANIEHLNGLTSVSGLDLSHSRISDDALITVGRMTGLEFLQLSRTNITDAGLAKLQNLVHLEAIDLSYTKVTQEGSAILENLPKLEVVCAAGTQLSSVKGVDVDRESPTESWLGIKYRPAWRTHGWKLAAPLATQR